MFATIKNLIPEPRQADQARHYVGRHRRAESAHPVTLVSPAPMLTATPTSPAHVDSDRALTSGGQATKANEGANA